MNIDDQLATGQQPTTDFRAYSCTLDHVRWP